MLHWDFFGRIQMFVDARNFVGLALLSTWQTQRHRRRNQVSLKLAFADSFYLHLRVESNRSHVGHPCVSELNTVNQWKKQDIKLNGSFDLRFPSTPSTANWFRNLKLRTARTGDFGTLLPNFDSWEIFVLSSVSSQSSLNFKFRTWSLFNWEQRSPI